MMKSSRLIAFEVLHRIFGDGGYSNLSLDSALADVSEDKAFITALVYGVVERKITLDYYINKYVASKPKPKIMTILRLGAYQLLYMDKVPSSAAINESVKLTKDIRQDYYAGLVNAVLHKIDEERDEVDDLSVNYSVPQNLINMWVKQYGEDTVKAFLPKTLEKPAVFAVPNTLYVDADELEYELLDEGIECEAVNGLVSVESVGTLFETKAYKNGLFHIEDISSYNCACALGAKAGETVIDMCSAPGGKAFTIAERMNNEGELNAFDLYESRLRLVDDGAQRLGITIIKTDACDATEYNENIPKADRILCDVPCSGFGIIRRKPEIKYKELDDIKELPKIQLAIASNAARYLKDGGTMIYSTCTLNKKENERVVEAFLKEHREFTLEEQKTVFTGDNGGDGFFYAKLVKLNEN